MCDDGAANVPLLNNLAAHGVLFNVVYEHDLTAALLQRYKAALVVAETVPSSAQLALTEFWPKAGSYSQ